jgi:hypothetical protein
MNGNPTMEKPMSLAGTVVNGSIVLDGGFQLPEGERVRVELERDLDEDDLGPPPEPHDHATHMQYLREALEDVKAGRTRPAKEAMAEIAAKHNLPRVQD